MTTPIDITSRTTHDLWVEGRQFSIVISRPSATTALLTITYPTKATAVDGAVITINKKAVDANNYPQDGTQYVASTDLAAPADFIGGTQGAQVVGFYSAILGNPLPGVANPATGTSTFTVTVTNAQPNVMYYASAHATSNVLQYYPFGIQSYPLEGSRVEKDVSAFTGSIPSLLEAPTAPAIGFVYFDQGLDIVQFWTGTQWIPTRADAILTGPVNPGVLGHVYFFPGLSQLRVFNGTSWIDATAANLQFRQGATWVPLGRTSANIVEPANPAAGDFFWNYTTSRPAYYDGAEWIYPTATNSLFASPTLVPAFVVQVTVEPDGLPAPFLGQLFYNLKSKVLNVWTGSGWIQANTDQQGTVSTDKITVGTDGSYDERLRLIAVLKTQLGWPVQCVELKEEHFNVAMDNALDNYRLWCDAAYKQAYILFTLIPDQQVYYLNSQVDKTDHVVSINKIHRLNILGANSLNWDSNIYFQTFLNQYYSSGYTDILSIHLLHSLSEEFQRIFAGDMMFNWDEASRELLITRKISRQEKCLIEATLERTEQELMIDRWSKQFIQNWALAECKMQLGLIRSKYSSGTPGAAGTINLNGELLVSEARQDMTDLKTNIQNYEYGGLIGIGNAAFLFG
jgi:hypothetical protein